MKPGKYLGTLAKTAVNIPTDPIMDLVDAIRETVRSRNRVFLCGNGGSAATADHFYLDFQKNISNGPATVNLNSTAAITAYANDIDYRTVYSEQITAVGQPGDLLICISTSGNSPNVLNAAICGRSLNMTVVTLTAGSGGELMKFGHITINVQTDNIGIAEDLHSAVLHSVVDYLKNGGD